MDILDKVKSIIKRNDTKEGKININQVKIYDCSDIEDIRMTTDEIRYREIWRCINSHIEYSVREGRYSAKVYFNNISFKEINNVKDKLIEFGFEVKEIKRDARYIKGLFISWERK